MKLTRREFIKWAAASAGTAAVAGCATGGMGGGPKVVVIGGGYGGATAARYTKLWAPDIDVTLVEPNAQFISCPISNLVLGGNAQMQDITMGYSGLEKHGIRIVRDSAAAIDAGRRQVRLGGGETLAYDRLIVSPGIEFMYDRIPGLRSAQAQSRVLHSWKAGPQTAALRKQLESIPDGGVYVLQVPSMPYRCPPGPYERVSLIADYFKKAKPRSKIIVLDSNPDIVSKKGLFLAAWNGMYKGMIDYRPNSELQDVDVSGMTVKLTFDNVKGDVLNVVPPQRAADIAVKTGLVTASNRWCEVNWLTCESVAVPGVHVIGDATQSASGMPKSGSMANQQAKVCAAAVIALVKGQQPNADPMMMNTCYSFVSGSSAMHVTSVHRYDPEKKAVLPVKGAGGVSKAASADEAQYAWGWARNIWAEALA
ncbi:MAG: NAD(P)/FAD-dependent oxidoreductase [Betaproteobacteria bacterium]|nr:NAD(P)/FAD-dependent oxidoreductase [Betaproteobacteria bacterium]